MCTLSLDIWSWWGHSSALCCLLLKEKTTLFLVLEPTFLAWLPQRGGEVTGGWKGMSYWDFKKSEQCLSLFHPPGIICTVHGTHLWSNRFCSGCGNGSWHHQVSVGKLAIFVRAKGQVIRAGIIWPNIKAEYFDWANQRIILIATRTCPKLQGLPAWALIHPVLAPISGIV